MMTSDSRTMIKEMIFIIVVFGVVAAVFEVLFAGRVIYSLAGILIGCCLAVYMLLYMNYILSRCAGLDAKGVEKYVVKHSVLRYLSVAIVFGVVCFTGIADPIACFIGLIGLKVAAYLQPVISKFRKRNKG